MNFIRSFFIFVDGFVPGAMLLKELGSRPFYLYLLTKLFKFRVRINQLVLLAISIIIVLLQPIVISIGDYFRYISHSILFFIWLSVSFGMIKLDLDVRKIHILAIASYFLAVIFSNLFDEFGMLTCSMFSHACDVKKFIHSGLSSEPSYLGIGILICCIRLFHKRKHVLYFSIFLSLFFFAMVSSKTGLLAIFIFIIFLVAKKISMIAASIIVSTLLFLSWDELQTFMIDRSFLIRGFSTLCGFDLFYKFFPVGVGAGQYSQSVHYCAFLPDLVEQQEFDVFTMQSRLSTYTLLSRLAAEFGVLGVILYLAWLFKMINYVLTSRSSILPLLVALIVSITFTQDSYILPFFAFLMLSIEFEKRTYASLHS